MQQGFTYTIRARYWPLPAPVHVQNPPGDFWLIPYESDIVSLWGGSPLNVSEAAKPIYSFSMLLTVRVDDLGEPVHVYVASKSGGFNNKYQRICTLLPSEVRTFELTEPLSAVVHTPEHADSLVYCCLHQSNYQVSAAPH